MTLRLDAVAIAPRDRAEWIRALIWQQVVKVEITHHSDPAKIKAVGQINDVGPLNICSIRSNATTVERTPRLSQDSSDAFVFLGLQLDGSSMVVQDGREAVLGPGDLALYDTRRQYSLLNASGINQHFFRLPIDWLDLPARTLEAVTALRFDSHRPLAEVTSLHLRHLASRAASMSEEERELVAGPTLALLRAMLRGQAHEKAGAGEDFERSLELQIAHFVRSHLADRELSPASIAAHHNISLRYLYTVLSARAETPMEWIMSARLGAAREDLALRAANGQLRGAVRAVAHQWGFADQSHLTRRFKAAYGVTPGDFLRHSGDGPGATGDAL